MTITAPPLSSSTSDATSASKGATAAVKPVRTRRSGGWGFAALALVLLGAVGGVFMFQTASNATQVFVAAGDITRGQLIEADDLSTISIAAGQNTTAISATKAKELLGTIAAVDIPSGGLITKSSTTTALAVPAGKALIGLTLQPGRLPAQKLIAGDNVVLVPVPAQGVADVEVTAADTIPAVVSQVRPIPNSNDVVVDVYVAAQAAPGVASKGAAGTIALFLAPGDK